LWMPGFDGEQRGLHKEREAKGKYGYSDIPPPPKRLLRIAGVKPAVEDDSYTEELRPQYPDIDFDNELEKFHLYWSEGGRTLKRPKLALKNWMDKAREFKGEKDGKHRGDTKKEKTGYTTPPKDPELEASAQTD